MPETNNQDFKKGMAMQINIDELTLGQIKEISTLLGNKDTNQDLQPYPIGKAMLLRTVTMTLIGVVVAVGNKELILEQASWVADTGRYGAALETGKLNEVEPYPDGQVIVGRGAIVDGCVWKHAVPRTQK